LFRLSLLKARKATMAGHETPSSEELPMGEKRFQTQTVAQADSLCYRKELPMAEKLFREGGEFGPIPEAGPSGFSRRDFLRLAGFALAGTALAGCQRAPVQNAVPFLVQPEDAVPGTSAHYASVCGGCPAGCGLLVKTRDGRPIKLEGNPEHPLSRGGLCAAGQASLLGLYDRHRLKEPLREGRPASWAEVDQAVRGQLQALHRQGRPVYFLTGSLVSPTTRALIRSFLDTFPGGRHDGRHVVHDPRSGSAILEAHARTHGVRLQPHYHLDQADVIVSFDADFLGAWISPVEFTAAYQGGRRPQGTPPRMSYHVQFESRLSLTGSKADQRLAVRPGDIGLVMSHLAVRLARRAGEPLPEERLEESPVPSRFLDHLVDVLWPTEGDRPSSLVLCGSDDVALQILANFLNHVLGNYGATVDVARPAYQVQGNDADLEHLLRELRAGRVGALFVHQCNPVHDLPNGAALAEELRRVPLLVCCAERLDETARLARFVCPVPHYLESWGDAEPVNGLVSLIQPVLTPLGNTRPLLESLAAWMGPPPGGRPQSAYDLLRSAWETEVFPRAPVALAALGASTVGLAGSPPEQGPYLAASALVSARTNRGGRTFDAFWNQTLHDGVVRVTPRPVRVGNFNQGAVRLVPRADRTPTGTYSVVLYAKVGLPDASHAYNPWLHELPDPISKVTWDNYACLSPATAQQLGVQDGDVVRLEASEADGTSRVLELPAFVQPGQHDQVVAVALGYGSRLSERFADIGPPWLEARPTVGANGLVGQNTAPLLTWAGGSLRCRRDGVRLTAAGRRHDLASTQGYHRLTMPPQLARGGQERRPIVQDTTLDNIPQRPARVPLPLAGQEPDLWPEDHPTEGPRWGMVIDHNACTGCSACVIACQAENNIPVVGKDEVRRHREMHWLRIDRYYAARAGGPGVNTPSGVDVVHQPMLCQHCGHAPCEPVCPVLATVHSAEGLNQQVYNRCVGTRYCANNCPYKVRRFNWFDYAHDDTLQNLALNPEVTVRSRGVMEKCTFCVQRIQEAKTEAAGQGRPLRDGDLQTACQQSCPARAITFGNLNDSQSRVARQAHDPRRYRVLEELNVRPAVTYLTLVRNRPVNTEGEGHG
jgi:Fe-S-cluster-containing dehydrogenase component/anaerobic selenocysteine-containing dehydrogenase